MNIGVDIKALFAGKAGIAAYIRSTLDCLQQIDTENRYFLFEKNPSPYRVKNPLWRKVLVSSRLPGTAWLMVTLPRLLARHSIDVFWGPEQIIPCVLPAGAPVMVSTVHDLALKRCPRTMQTTNYFINRIFLRKSLRASHTVLAVSQTVKADLCAYFPGDAPHAKVTVVYNGRPHTDTGAGMNVPRGDHLLFAGSFEPRKNLFALLGALSILKKEKNLAVPLYIAGPSGWKNGPVRDYLETSGLKDHVTLLGYLDDGDLAREYRRCRAFVYPSIYEGFGLPVLEALAAGAPVLTSKGTAMEEIAGECCTLFDAGNPRDIAEKIATVYSPNFDSRLLLANRDAVLGRFSWEATARQTLAVFTGAYARTNLHVA